MSGAEKITGLTSEMVLGYFETMKSCFFVKYGILGWFEAGDLRQHAALSKTASEMASEFGDPLAAKTLSSIQPEVVENLKEDAVTALVVSGWSVFEQIIKDLTVPDYSTKPILLQADYNNGLLGFTPAERRQIDLFYHLRNAIVHYNGAYHAYRTVDVTYEGRHFKSNGHIGEKIEVSPKLVLQIVQDLEKYAMQAWTHCNRS